MLSRRKKFYIEREKYWKKQKELEKQRWLDSKIDFEKEIKIFLCGNSNYDIDYAKNQLKYWLYEDKNNEIDTIHYWEKSSRSYEKT